MKSPGIVVSFLATPARRRNFLALGRLVLIFTVMVVIFTVIFASIRRESIHDHSWCRPRRAGNRAGADFVMSCGSSGANSIYNILKRGNSILLAEGLDVFRVHVPHATIGRTLDSAGFAKRPAAMWWPLRRTGIQCQAITIISWDSERRSPNRL